MNINKNFISKYMTKEHVKLAFGVTKNEQINALIADGWLLKYYQYFRPTAQLYQCICPDVVEIKDFSRLNKNPNRFGLIDIEEIFDCNYWTSRTIAEKYFVKTQFGFYKRSDKLDQLLADGETKLQLK